MLTIEDAIKTSLGFREAARKLGKNHQWLKRQVVKNGIDCSHFNITSIVGKKFEMLTVLSVGYSGNVGDNRRRAFAMCQCDCGNTKQVRIDSLKAGRYVSCGCHSKNRWNTVASNNHSFTGHGEIRSTYYREMKKSAERRKLDFDVSIEELWKIFQDQNYCCALTGLPIRFGRVYYPNETTASPDRIDNHKGYVTGNIRWVLKDINMMRGGYETEYFLNLCNLVARFNPRDITILENPTSLKKDYRKSKQVKEHKDGQGF